jgi:hypothetical protein
MLFSYDKRVYELCISCLYTLYVIWLSNILALNVPEEGYSRDVPEEGYSRDVPEEGYSILLKVALSTIKQTNTTNLFGDIIKIVHTKSCFQIIHGNICI